MARSNGRLLTDFWGIMSPVDILSYLWFLYDLLDEIYDLFSDLFGLLDEHYDFFTYLSYLLDEIHDLFNDLFDLLSGL